MTARSFPWILALLALIALPVSADEPKTLLLLGQDRDHPVGSHEYMPGLRILEKCLVGVPNLKTEVLLVNEPWPEGQQQIDRADGIVLYLGEGGRFMQFRPERLKAIEALAARGGAIVGLHWGIGAKADRFVAKHVELMGGMHGGSDRKYIVTATDVRVADRQHPITQGVSDLRLDDEFYYRLKFATQGKVTPLLSADINGQAETIAWAYERPDGGRSFGFGCMHYHRHWNEPSCRRLIVQGILWSLKLPIPEGGMPLECGDSSPRSEPATK